MSLASNIASLATRIATELKSHKTLINGNATDLSALTTTAKGNLVAAINEVAGSAAGASGIDDGVTGSTTTWSSSKIDTEIDAAVAAVPNPILDTGTSTTKAWSSSKTQSEINTAVAAKPSINDAATNGTSVWSSTKTNSEIAAKVSALVAAAPTALDTLDELAAALGDDANFAATMNAALGNRVRVDASQTLNGTQQNQARTNIGAASATALAQLVTDVGDTNSNFVTTFEAGLV